jgi:hypothetical protein
MESESEPGTAVAGVERRQTTECGLLGSGGSRDLNTHHAQREFVARPDHATDSGSPTSPHAPTQHARQRHDMSDEPARTPLTPRDARPDPAITAASGSRHKQVEADASNARPCGQTPGTRLREKSRYPRALSPTTRCLIKSEPILPFRERCAAATIERVRAADPGRTQQARSG